MEVIVGGLVVGGLLVMAIVVLLLINATQNRPRRNPAEDNRDR